MSNLEPVFKAFNDFDVSGCGAAVWVAMKVVDSQCFLL